MRIVTIIVAFVLAVSQGPAPKRVVSLIPAVTEMLFAIGAGPQLVGVGSDCPAPRLPYPLKKIWRS